jgi:hypothetical protein
MSEYIKQRAESAVNIADIHGMSESERNMFMHGYEMGARFIKGLYEGVWIMGDGIETAEQLIDAVNKRIGGDKS